MDIKEKINNISFDLSLPKYNGFNLIAYVIGNGWTNSNQREEAMAKRMKQISEELENLILEIKLKL